MIQMYWYFLFFMAILTAISLDLIVQKIPKLGKYVLVVAVIAISFPSAGEKLRNTVVEQGSFVGGVRLESLEFLKNCGSYNQTVLEIPKLSSYDFQSLNGWFGPSTPILSAFGNKRTFVGGEVVSFPYKEKDDRLKSVSQFMQPEIDCALPTNQKVCDSSLDNSRNILDRENIAFIYAPAKINWFSQIQGVVQVFKNEEISIYQVK